MKFRTSVLPWASRLGCDAHTGWYHTFTWNSCSSFFSIQSVTWTRVTSLSPSFGRAFSSTYGGFRKPYLFEEDKSQTTTFRGRQGSRQVPTANVLHLHRASARANVLLLWAFPLNRIQGSKSGLWANRNCVPGPPVGLWWFENSSDTLGEPGSTTGKVQDLGKLLWFFAFPELARTSFVSILIKVVYVHYKTPKIHV